jgi:hypothetical protein
MRWHEICNLTTHKKILICLMAKNDVSVLISKMKIAGNDVVTMMQKWIIN